MASLLAPQGPSNLCGHVSIYAQDKSRVGLWWCVIGSSLRYLSARTNDYLI